MSVLSDERWRAVEPYLDRALERTPGERASLLAQLRASEPAVADDLEALLAARDELSQRGFLEGMPPQPPAQASLAGQTVGPYTLTESIGRGGMGSVWLARRSDGRFEGTVAVKLLNASLVGRVGEERFRREGSILGRLTHPNVARLYDAGVSGSGQPYIVLEHVDGEPIDRYCDARRLGIEARLRLFLDVCAAVAHAHGRLIVHRDIKPSNVLVARDGQVKLLDFGIAKLLEEGDGDTTALTREGGRALTPAFAAPEQLGGGAVTTATDVHALGTLLYLLLVGRHPAGEDLDNPAGLLRAILETDPRRPSEAVAATDVAARATTLDGLRRQLSGDLDTIVTKALKKDPAERYGSAEALAADVRHSLAHEPIAARPDTFGYRTAKFVRRHRWGVAAGLVAAAALAAGTAAILLQSREAKRQRDDARAELARSTATNEFLSFLLSAAAPPGRKFVVSDLLEQGEVVANKQFAGDDALRAELLFGIGRQYVGTERWEKAVPVLEQAADLAGRAHATALAARTRCSLALAYTATKGKKEGAALMQQALAELPDDPRYALARADCLTRQSETGYFTDEGRPMVEHATQALALLDGTPIAARLARLDAQSALAYGYYLLRQNVRADRAFAELMKELQATGRDRTLAAADVWNNWSLVHFLGDIRRAEDLQRRCLELHRSIEGEDAVNPGALHNYAGILFQLARYAEAEPYYLAAIRATRARDDRREEIDATLSLAILYARTGRHDDAAKALASLDAPRYGKFLANTLRRGFLAYTRGSLALARGDAAAARDRFAESVALYDQVDAKYVHSFLALVDLSRSELATGHPEAAEEAARRAVALAESLVEKESPSYLIGLSEAALGEARLARGDPSARATLSAAVTQLEQTLGPEHPSTVRTRQLAGAAGS